MKIATSRLTQQGQVSIPAEVRRRLGLVPGAVIEWDSDGDNVVVRRAGRYTSTDIHEAVFGSRVVQRVSSDDMDAAIGAHLLDKHAGR